MSPIVWRAVLILVLCASAAATQGPILAFHFDGDYADATGNTAGLTAVNAQPFVAGVGGGQAAYLSVDTSSYLVSAAPLAILPSGNAPRSVSAWLRLVSCKSDTSGGPLVTWGTTETGAATVLGVEGYLGFLASNIDVWGPADPPANVWAHVAYTFDGVHVVLYLNGVVQAPTYWAGVPQGYSDFSGINTTPNTILRVGFGLPGWNGLSAAAEVTGAIDELLIYDRALSPGEVAGLAVQSASATPSTTPSPTPNPSCLPSAYTAYPYADLSGVVLSVAMGAPSEKDCQLACCNAAQCSGYSWAGMLPNLACFLFTNVTGLTPNLLFSSGVLVVVTPPPTPAATPSRSVPASVSVSPRLAGSNGLARSSTGTAFMTPSNSPTVTVAPSATSSFIPGTIRTFAGNGVSGYTGDNGEATLAKLSPSGGIAINGAGDVYIGDDACNCVRFVITSTGIISTFAGSGVYGYSGDGGPATLATLWGPRGLAVDGTALYIATQITHCVRRVSLATGIITTIAGTGAQGYTGDGGQATLTRLSYPTGVAVNSVGNVYIAEMGAASIRFINMSTGIISTLTYSYGFGVALDSMDNVYTADTFNHQVRLVNVSTGAVSTLAGNGSPGYTGDGEQATTSELNYPYGVAVDIFGNVFIADSQNSRIRVITKSTGIISTFAGNGSVGYSGDGGQPASAELNYVPGVAIDNKGTVYISDSGNQRIRVVEFVFSPTSTSSVTPTPSPSHYCFPSLYRPLPRTDLVGALVGNAWYPGSSFPSSSEAACRQACCDAPVCDAYTFATTDLLQFTLSSPTLPPVAQCFLYTNVTALVPNSGYTSGALLSTYS